MTPYYTLENAVLSPLSADKHSLQEYHKGYYLVYRNT